MINETKKNQENDDNLIDDLFDEAETQDDDDELETLLKEIGW